METNEIKGVKDFIIKTIKGFGYAGKGIFTAIKSERNMKIHMVCMILVIICGIVFNLSKAEWIICVMLFAGVIASEMFNTAIEKVVDMVMPDINEKAKVAKDVAAGAVLVWAICSAIIGCIIFIPKIM